MSLNYRRDYKKQRKQRKIITIVAIFVIFVCASAAVLLMRRFEKNPDEEPVAQQDQTTEVTEATEATTETTTEDTTEVTEATTEATEGQTTEVTTEATEDTEATTEAATEKAATSKGRNKELGKPITRQPLSYFSIVTAPISPSEVQCEYTKNEKTVDDSYFDDAVFIGDSRTEGFAMYSSLENIHHYSSKGLSVTRIYEDQVVTMEDGRVLTVMDALKETQFSKIYIMFGVNELGWPEPDLFGDQYEKVIQDIKQLQPDAIIYVQNILPISAEKSASDPIYNNANVNALNEQVKRVCEDEQVVYLDVASAVVGSDGALPADASNDGVHMNGEYCDKWLQYLKENTYTSKVVVKTDSDSSNEKSDQKTEEKSDEKTSDDEKTDGEKTDDSSTENEKTDDES